MWMAVGQMGWAEGVSIHGKVVLCGLSAPTCIFAFSAQREPLGSAAWPWAVGRTEAQASRYIMTPTDHEPEKDFWRP